MELQFYGANCIRLVTKKATIVIDDNLAELGLKSVTRPGDVALFTGAHASPAVDVKLLIDSPGEYEVSDVSIQGVAARAHIDNPEQRSCTVFRLLIDDLRVCVTGHIFPELNDAQLEVIGTTDVLIIPVGGNGYTLDGVGALHLIKEIEPKLIIPTHYADAGLAYPVPQQDLGEALKNLAMEPAQTVPKLKVKSSDLTDLTQLIVLERQ